jgi:hypothetical protein
MTEQPSLQDRLADAFKDADYDLPIEQRRDLADTALTALKRELDALAEYENTINWMTTCTSCARILDSSIRETERAERAEAELARLHEGEEPVINPAVMHTPAQWIWQWNRAPLEKRLQVVEAAMRDGAAAHDCRINGHTERIHDGRHAEMALIEVQNVVANMGATTGARTWAGWLRDALKRGREHCLLCASEPKAEPAPPGPAATEATERTEEQNLVHALGGDRTAQTIAHTLTVHGHTLNAVRTMTYAELLAVPGIGGTSLARIRAALDGVPEPDAAAATRPGEAAIARVRVLHRRNANTGECEYCSFRDYPTYAVPYPCDTVRALDGQEQPGA